MTAHDELKLQLLQRPGVDNHLLPHELLARLVLEYTALTDRCAAIHSILQDLYENGRYDGSWLELSEVLKND